MPNIKDNFVLFFFHLCIIISQGEVYSFLIINTGERIVFIPFLPLNLHLSAFNFTEILSSQGRVNNI